MAHLSNFGVGNFRSFKGTYNFDFKPITILTGTNSSGKSSLTKALLLMKEPFGGVTEKSVPYVNTKFDVDILSLMKLKFGSQTQLGNFEVAKNHDCSNDSIAFEFPFKLPNSTSPLKLILVYSNDNSKIQNGLLSSLHIKNITTGEELISISKKGFNYKINYRGLWAVLSKGMTDIADLDGLRKELEAVGLSLKDLDKPDLPDNIRTMHSKIKDLVNVYTYPRHNFQDNYSHLELSGPCIYYRETSDHSFDRNFKELQGTTFLNYLFLYKSEWVEKNVHLLYSELTKDEIDNLLIDYHSAQQKIRALANNEHSYYDIIREWEFQGLDLIKGSRASETYVDHMDFTDVINDTSKILEVMEYGDDSSVGPSGHFIKYFGSHDRYDEPIRNCYLVDLIQKSNTPLADILSNKFLIIDKPTRGFEVPGG